MGIHASQLREGQQILVRGKISFSRLAKLVEGEALAKSVEQARKRGQQYPTTVPHTTVSLVEAQVIPATPGALTPEEQYVTEKLYTVKSGNNQGKIGFGIDNKSNYLPTVLEQSPENPGAYRQLVLPQDLASGMDVTLVLNVFASGYSNKGLGLQQVILNEPVRYYSGGVDTNALAARGIVVEGPIRVVPGSEATANVADAPAPAALPNTVVGDNGLAAPAPVIQVPQTAPAAPVAAPTADVEALRAQLAAAEAAAAAQATQPTPQGASAFDAGTVPSPWD